MLRFDELGLPVNLVLFAVGAAAVWAAGTRIAQYANAISARTGLGQALLGVILLGGVTSLPEFATSLTAAAADNAELAVNNILGGVAMQVAILVIADIAIGRRALTSVVPDPQVMLQGTLNVVLLSMVAAAVVVGDLPVFGVGAWAWAILAFCVYSFWKLTRSEGRRPWIANIDESLEKQTGAEPGAELADSWPLLIARTAAAAAVIFVAGYVVASTGEAIAEQTALGSSFVGAVLVALATSLPELSTVLAAVRLGLYTMAISDILGTNIFDIALLFCVDAVASGAPVLNRVGAFSVVGALLGIAVTTLFLMGLAERRNRTVLRMGEDSVAVLIVYLGGVMVLYALR